MKNYVKRRWLATQMQWHWLFIVRGKQLGNILLDVGLPLSSGYLVRLSCRLTTHCAKLMGATDGYEALIKRPAKQYASDEIIA